MSFLERRADLKLSRLVAGTALAREERYLEAKFGNEYARYRNRVRRWL